METIKNYSSSFAVDQMPFDEDPMIVSGVANVDRASLTELIEASSAGAEIQALRLTTPLVFARFPGYRDFLQGLEHGPFNAKQEDEIDSLPLGRAPHFLRQIAARSWVNTWALVISNARITMGLHYDAGVTQIFAQLFGSKEVILAAPDARQDGPMYPYRGIPFRSRVYDASQVDSSRFPEFAKVGFLRCVLKPGDVLYVPADWWHQTRPMGDTVTLLLRSRPANVSMDNAAFDADSSNRWEVLSSHASLYDHYYHSRDRGWLIRAENVQLKRIGQSLGVRLPGWSSFEFLNPLASALIDRIGSQVSVDDIFKAADKELRDDFDELSHRAVEACIAGLCELGVLRMQSEIVQFLGLDDNGKTA